MRRAALLALLAVAAAGCGAERRPAASGPPPDPAEPRVVDLGWREHYGEGASRLVFEVDRLEVTPSGWSADVSFANRTRVAWRIDVLRHELGLVLLPTGDLAELERLAADGLLPPVRRAETVEPALPDRLAPGDSWSGELRARGSLPAGAWARVVFGPFSAAADPPEGMEPVIVWITDRTTRL